MSRCRTSEGADPRCASVALVEAVQHLGGQAATARLLGITQPSVWAWLKNGKPLPGEHVLKVEGATGISRHDLRPDLYPRESASDHPEPSYLAPAR